MKKQEDNFILMDIQEFSKWIQDEKIDRKINLIQNHHTMLPSYEHFNGSNHFQRLKAMRNYHVNHNGWSDIAQNFTTFPDGTIAVCRTLNKVPAGIKGANSRGICIEHFGNFDIDKDLMTEVHRSLIVKLNALLCEKFNLIPSEDTIVYHHWYDLKSGKRTNGAGTTKTCPGTNFFSGNKVEDAKTNFIPLINKELKKISKNTNFKLGVVTANILNVRNGAGMNHKIVGSLKNGEKVTVLEKIADWYKIENENKWVSAKYIKLQ